MVLIDKWSATARWRLPAAIAALTLMPASAWAIPQAQTGGRATTTVRAGQCSECAREDAERRLREVLLVRLDSLRWAIDHRRLTESERQHAAEELANTLKALEASSARETRALMAMEAEAAAQGHRAQRVAVAATRTLYRNAGYIGVTFDGLWARPPGSAEDNLIRFYEYPRIALVEASSPAERAGVLAGDTLLALNGDDVKENEIAFGRLLIPNRRIVMRVRRDGNPRDLALTVGVAPEYFARRSVPAQPPAAVAAPRSPEPSPAGAVRVYGVAPSPRPGEAAGFMYWFGNDALAGARLETVSGGLARALDVPEGVLVIRTVPGTAMYRSGLREGDIVTHVGRTKVRSVSELQRALTSGDEKERRLLIVREKKQRQITLRW